MSEEAKGDALKPEDKERFINQVFLNVVKVLDSLEKNQDDINQYKAPGWDPSNFLADPQSNENEKDAMKVLLIAIIKKLSPEELQQNFTRSFKQFGKSIYNLENVDGQMKYEKFTTQVNIQTALNKVEGWFKDQGMHSAFVDAINCLDPHQTTYIQETQADQKGALSQSRNSGWNKPGVMVNAFFCVMLPWSIGSYIDSTNDFAFLKDNNGGNAALFAAITVAFILLTLYQCRPKQNEKSICDETEAEGKAKAPERGLKLAAGLVLGSWVIGATVDCLKSDFAYLKGSVNVFDASMPNAAILGLASVVFLLLACRNYKKQAGVVSPEPAPAECSSLVNNDTAPGVHS
jgi:hypothetical protein